MTSAESFEDLNQGVGTVSEVLRSAMDPLTDFSTFTFAHHGKSRTVYRRGTGPAVIITHEIPGITPEGCPLCRHDRVHAALFGK